MELAQTNFQRIRTRIVMRKSLPIPMSRGLSAYTARRKRLELMGEPRFTDVTIRTPHSRKTGVVEDIWKTKDLPRHIKEDQTFKLRDDYLDEYTWTDQEKKAWRDRSKHW